VLPEPDGPLKQSSTLHLVPADFLRLRGRRRTGQVNLNQPGGIDAAILSILRLEAASCQARHAPKVAECPNENASHCRGQQPGPPPPIARATIDGGQLIAGLAPGQGAAAGVVPGRHLGSEHSRADTRVTGGTPLTHFGSEQLCGAAAAGGTPLMQSGVGQEAGAATGGGPPFHFGGPPPTLAGVAARLSEPTVRTAESTAPAINRLR